MSAMSTLECSQSLSLSRKRRNNESTDYEEEEHGDITSKNQSAELNRSKRTRRSDELQNSENENVVEHKCGKLLRIHLTNFMCHANLTFKFNKGMNFLIGTNGSGKSAILAATVLGLGGKAKDTNRATSMKQFIKTGETTAKIEIDLYNDGVQAYDPDKFGLVITVIRNITATTSTYIIKNAYGRVISKKYEDLARILLYFNIQIDNNVFVLNQDAAREFLKELEPHKNYLLFLQATQLKLFRDNINDCIIDNRSQKNSLQCFEQRLEYQQKAIQELKDKLEQIMSVENVKELLKDCEVELEWSNVIQIQTQVQEKCNDIKMIEERKEELINKVQKKDTYELELTQKRDEYLALHHEKGVLHAKENEKCLEIKNTIQQVNKKYSEVSAFMDSLHKRKDYFKLQIKEIENHMRNRSEQNVADIAETRERNAKSLEELRKTKGNNVTALNKAKDDLNVFLENKLQKEEQIRQVKRTKAGYEENLRHINRDIISIKNTKKDKLYIYGEFIPLLRNEIAAYMRANKFSDMPRGPLGSYIDVKNPKYRDVVELQLGNLLHAFIVNNKRDRQLLEAILKNKFNNRKINIITARFHKKVYDVSKYSVVPPAGTTLLMNEIKCDDPVVMNCLIDRIQIETVLFADNKETAENLTAYRENVPTHLQKILVPQQGFQYHPEPNYRMYSIRIPPARFLQVNISDRTRQLENEKHEMELKVGKIVEKLQELVRLEQMDSKYINDKQNIIDSIESKNREINQKIEELEGIDYPEYNEIDVLKKELHINASKLEEYQKKIDSKSVELNETKAERERLQSEYREKERSVKSLENELQEIQMKASALEREKNNLNKNFQENQKKLTNLQDVLHKIMSEKTKKEKELKEAIDKAQAKGERISSERSQEEICDEIKRLKAKLKQQSHIIDEPVELKKLIESKEETLNTERETHARMAQSVEGLNNAIKKRLIFMKSFRQHLVFLLDFTFNRILRLRKFVGHINVDHEKQLMYVTIIPREDTGNNAKSTRSLSGGERSYSTVAFLVSLWSCVDHPFFFLDEYDVFTDDVNREFMTRLLISVGEARPQRQYIFLTPLDMNLEARNDVKIFRLVEPKR